MMSKGHYHEIGRKTILVAKSAKALEKVVD